MSSSRIKKFSSYLTEHALRLLYRTQPAIHVSFEVFTAVTMKNAVFWDVRGVALVRTDVSEERIGSIIRVKRSSEIGTKLAVTSK
jgi:hypothetical protein